MKQKWGSWYFQLSQKNNLLMKRVFIIHGWEGYPEDGWYPWLKKELEKNGFEVFVPAMPNTDEPKIDEWVDSLSNLVGKPDENTYFVGHSIGCQTILRYLEKLENKKIGGVVCVAGWFILSDLETEEEKIIGKPWIETPIDFNKVIMTTNNFVAIFSDDDPVVPLKENEKIFNEKLNAKIIIERNRGHFSEGDGVTELPVVLDSILNF